MKLEIGQIWENSYGTMECVLASPCGKVGIFLSESESAITYSLNELEDEGYQLQTKEMPPDGTVLKVFDDNSQPKVRVSSGKVDQYGAIIVYVSGDFKGGTISYDKWEVVK